MRYTLERIVGGEALSVEVEILRLGPGRFSVRHGANEAEILDVEAQTELMHLHGADRSVAVRIGARGEERHVHLAGRDLLFRVVDERRRRQQARAAGAAGSGTSGRKVVRSPMPGKVVQVSVEVGQRVEPGQALLIIEAMKMENELKSPMRGIVTEIKVRAGETVEGGAELLSIEADAT